MDIEKNAQNVKEKTQANKSNKEWAKRVANNRAKVLSSLKQKWDNAKTPEERNAIRMSMRDSALSQPLLDELSYPEDLLDPQYQQNPALRPKNPSRLDTISNALSAVARPINRFMYRKGLTAPPGAGDLSTPAARAGYLNQFYVPAKAADPYSELETLKRRNKPNE